ncbi:MAG: hypothetical protein LQ340_005320 [Diploschistes diacapsis]|nr:MAG: hypothetical protein LQ340_005320 [Diploschistes diacapsis]
MSAVAEPPTPTPSRRQRGKTSRRKEHSKLLQSNVADIPLTPKTTPRTSYADPRSYNTSTSSDGIVSPLTPPCASSTLDMAQMSLDSSTSPILSKSRNGRGRKRISAKPELDESAPWKSMPHAAPSLAEQSQATATPLKQAKQIYAGPTFHTSPAPSSLPIPKFFAKPTPLGDKISDLNPLPSDDESSRESSNENGNDSPTLRTSLRGENLHAREPSPLDIFFKADREEKARRSQDSPQDAAHVSDRAKSAGPSTQFFKPGEVHARLQTGSPSTIERSEGEEFRVKTEALKQLLLAPRAQQSSPMIASSRDSPSSGLPYRPKIERASSGSSTPSRLFPSSIDPTRSESSLHDSPSILSFTERVPQSRRPLPYHVRQDLLSKLPIDQKDASSRSKYITPAVP